MNARTVIISNTHYQVKEMKNKETQWFKNKLGKLTDELTAKRIELFKLKQYGEKKKELWDLEKPELIDNKSMFFQPGLDKPKIDPFPMGCTFDWPTDEAIDMENPITQYAKDKNKPKCTDECAGECEDEYGCKNCAPKMKVIVHWDADHATLKLEGKYKPNEVYTDLEKAYVEQFVLETPNGPVITFKKL